MNTLIPLELLLVKPKICDSSTTAIPLVVNSEAKKYKTAPLQHRDLLEKLFDGLSATGDFAWSSGMASVPSTQQKEYVPLLDDMNVDDTQVSHAGVDYPWECEAIPSYDAPISPVMEPTPGGTSCTQVGVRTQRGKDQLRQFNQWNQQSLSNL
ncbi:hypothetical protein GIB67_035465 [Kingdonia uniflora]|uniref:Uncharacterized protein n=1 Tax=Kingdonia uniflora TaxID=39325 RepID=A0A7J7P0G9_9MAGN|nr:hypothetical protein GIB67_035465 [Kingdonia uniflora]